MRGITHLIIHNEGVEFAGCYLRFHWNNKTIKPKGSSCAGKVAMGSIPGDLCLIRQKLVKFFSEHFGSPRSVSFNHCSLLVFTQGYMLLLPKDKQAMLGKLKKAIPCRKFGALSVFLYSRIIPVYFHETYKKGALLWV
jgi:hypothetical protein